MQRTIKQFVIFALLLLMGGCAGFHDRHHPAVTGREDITYAHSTSCDALERNFALAIAWENWMDKVEMERGILGGIAEGIALASAPPGSVRISTKVTVGSSYSYTTLNSHYLYDIRYEFQKQGCGYRGYKAYMRNPSDNFKKRNGLFCERDKSTGFYLCLPVT